MELANQDIINLIEIGRSGINLKKNQFDYFGQRDYINRLHWKTWSQFVLDLTDIDLIYLYGNRKSKDYFEYRNQKANQRIFKTEQYSKVLKRVEGRKDKRKQAITELSKLTNDERGKKLEELKSKYSGLSTLQKLQIMAKDEVYPPEYYPHEWIEIEPDELKTFPINLIKNLHDKLSSKTIGQWKRFAAELAKLDDRNE